MRKSSARPRQFLNRRGAKCTIQGGVPKISVETSPRKTFKEREKNQIEPMDNNWT